MNKKYLVAGLGVGILALGAVSVALAANGNYSSWRTTLGAKNNRAATQVTEQNFDRYSEMHQDIADGKYAEAEKIRTELGLGERQGQGQGQGRQAAGGCGGHQGTGQQGTGQGGGEHDEDFVDANKNGICDHHEQLTK